MDNMGMGLALTPSLPNYLLNIIVATTNKMCALTVPYSYKLPVNNLASLLYREGEYCIGT